MPIPITDLDDPRVALFRDVRDKDLRGRDRHFMAESEMVLRRLLRTPDRLVSMLLSPARFEALRDALEPLGDDIPVYVADQDLMTRIAGFHIHRGVLALGRRPAWHEVTLDRALGHLRNAGPVRLVIAEGLTNVDNLGGLFRNAAGFGVDGIVLDPSCCDPLYRKAIRVSMGHVLSIPYAVCQDWPGDLERLARDWDVTLLAAETTENAVPAWSMPRDPRLGLVLGSEGHGLSAPALQCCHHVVEIPMPTGVPSLNVSVAAGVLLYEMTRPD